MTFPERNPLQHLDPATAWFGDRFGVSLPRGLREHADAMSWETFVATYGRSTGPLRLGQWECTDAVRPGPQARNFQAVIALGDRIGTATVAASGPIAALTAMLHQRGITVEIVNFHQMQSPTAQPLSSAAATVPAPSGRWASRTIRRSRRCARSSPAPTGCSRSTDAARNQLEEFHLR